MSMFVLFHLLAHSTVYRVLPSADPNDVMEPRPWARLGPSQLLAIQGRFGNISDSEDLLWSTHKESFRREFHLSVEAGA